MTADDTPQAQHAAPRITTVTFTASGGVELSGDLAVVDNAVAAAIVCHPHPEYGGNRFNDVVTAMFEALPQAGVTTLRFDFRSEFGGGVDEQLDAVAAIGVVAEAAPDLAVFAVGYSFGAMVTLALTDDRIVGKALVAPPLGAMDLAPGGDVPTLVLSPAHDQFAPPSVAEPIVASWPEATFETIDSVDHFLTGRTSFVADKVTAWITQPGYFHPGWK